MKTSKLGRYSLVMGLISLMGIAWLTSGWTPDSRVAAADNDKETALAQFMRKKLEASSLVLEGLAMEDADLIQEGAKNMLEMSKAEIWQVLLDKDYRDFNQDFRSSLRKLNESAGEKHFDRALLEWMDSVKGCVDCHNYVRAHRPKLNN